MGVVLSLGGGESEGIVRLKSFAVVLSLGCYVEPSGNQGDSARWPRIVIGRLANQIGGLSQYKSSYTPRAWFLSDLFTSCLLHLVE